MAFRQTTSELDATNPMGMTSEQLKKAGYSIGTTTVYDSDIGYYEVPAWLDPKGNAAPFSTFQIQLNDKNYQAQVRAEEEKAGNFRYVGIGGDEESGQGPTDYVKVPKASPDYKTPESIAKHAAFQDVNAFSGGQLGKIADAINSGEYKITDDKSKMVTPYGSYALRPLGNGLYDIPIGARSGSYNVAIGVNDKGEAQFDKKFLDAGAIRYQGGSSGGFVSNMLNDLGPVSNIALAALMGPGAGLLTNVAAQTALNAAKGQDFEDALKSGIISGGIATGIGSLTGGVPGLGAEGALSEAALSDIAAQQAAGAAMSGAGAAGAAGAGGIADLLADDVLAQQAVGNVYTGATPSSLGVPDFGVGMDLGEGIAADYTAPDAGVFGSGVPNDVPNYGVGEDMGEGISADYTAPDAGIDWTNPDNWDKAGLGDPGMGGAAPTFGISNILKGVKNFLGKDTGIGGLTGGGALLGAAGLYKLIDMIKEDNKRFGTPGRQDYTGGALSKFKYDPGSFTPTRADPSKFRPTTIRTLNQDLLGPIPPTPVAEQTTLGMPLKMFAEGGKTKRPELTSKAKLAALDPYLRAIAEMNNAAYAARMPQGMQAPAANVSQMGQFQFAGGGISDLGGYSDGGRLLRGPGDGVSDSIPAVIGGKQPARLADGEFVVPARIVSELGNGSTDAGARKLYAMMDRIQKARGATTGKGKVAKNTRADKHLPA